MTAVPHTAAILTSSGCLTQMLGGSQREHAWEHTPPAIAAKLPPRKNYTRSRLVADGDLKLLNVGRRGHLSFKDVRVERLLHFRYQSLNTSQPRSASRKTPRTSGEQLCRTTSTGCRSGRIDGCATCAVIRRSMSNLYLDCNAAIEPPTCMAPSDRSPSFCGRSQRRRCASSVNDSAAGCCLRCRTQGREPERPWDMGQTPSWPEAFPHLRILS